jgi:hypothetical protein
MNKYSAREELLEAVFLVHSMPRIYSEDPTAAQIVSSLKSCIVSSHYLEMTSQQTQYFMHAVVLVIYLQCVLISETVVGICGYEL